MNRTWRVITDRGMWAVKEILDVTIELAQRQHRAVMALKDRGQPVPVPAVADDDTIAVIDGAAFAVLPWVPDEHLGGLELDVSDAEALGRLHLVLAAVLPTAADRLVVPVTEPGTAAARIDRYLAAIA